MRPGMRPPKVIMRGAAGMAAAREVCDLSWALVSARHRWLLRFLWPARPALLCEGVGCWRRVSAGVWLENARTGRLTASVSVCVCSVFTRQTLGKLLDHRRY